MIQENRFPTQNESVALVLAFAPFICNFTTTTSRTVNGVTVEKTSIDYADIGLGALAVLVGLTLLPTVLRAEADMRLKHAVIFALVVGVGFLHVLLGADIL
ncbi:MAG: hypothetical protein K8I82_13890 [Anaerolineae bacterium]|nr:hypothetical protein [Anaerolineae bacterium]